MPYSLIEFMNQGFIFTEMLVAIVIVSISLGIGLRSLYQSQMYSQKIYRQFIEALDQAAKIERSPDISYKMRGSIL